MNTNNTVKHYKKILKLKKGNIIKAILIIVGLILLLDIAEWMKQNDEEMIANCMKNEVNNRNYCYRQVRG